MAEEKICSSCGGASRKGFYYVTNSEQAILFNFVVWVEGEKNAITSYMGTKASAPQYPLTPYKCANCGHIDIFADEAQPWRH